MCSLSWPTPDVRVDKLASGLDNEVSSPTYAVSIDHSPCTFASSESSVQWMHVIELFLHLHGVQRRLLTAFFEFLKPRPQLDLYIWYPYDIARVIELLLFFILLETIHVWTHALEEFLCLTGVFFD